MPVYPMQMDLTTGRALVGPLGSGMIGSGSLTSGMQIPAPVVVSGPLTIVPTAAPGTAALLQVISGVGFQRTATTPRQGLLTFVNTLVSGAVAAISGPGVLVEHYTDLFQVTFTPPAAPGSAFNYATPSFQMGSGGMKAASGYWALSSWVGSGQIGNNHLAAQAVQSNSIASGQAGEGHIWLTSNLIVRRGGTSAPITVPAGTMFLKTANSGNIRDIIGVVSGGIAIWGVEDGTAGDSFYVAIRPPDGNVEIGIKNLGSSYIFGISGVHAASGIGAFSSFIVSGQIGGTHLAAGAVVSANIASGALGGTQWNPTTAIVGLIVSGVISAGGHIEAASGLWGGQQAPVANVVGELAQALSAGITYFRTTNLAIGSGVGAAFGVYVGSGTGTNKRPVAVFVGLNAVSAGPSDPVGIGQILLFDPNVGQILAYQFGSGGTTAASGYAALSSFIGSGQIGGNHLAAGAVLSANIASGHVGNNHLRLMSGLVISGSLGIGVAPVQILHVAQSNGGNVILRIDNMVDTSGTGIQIQMVDGANTFELGGLEVINLSGGGVSELHLRTRIQGSTVRRMSILSGGNIIAASGFGAISSFIRSGTVGGFHLAMPTVSGVYAWGTVAFFNPASGWLSVAPGLSGQRLTTNGSGFDPAWAA